ncbi:MAG: hypothetical protein IKF59_11250 [Lachnospiraceae bacterium]|nr:hypothetical protein [Lachnospiraceae bacterium]
MSNQNYTNRNHPGAKMREVSLPRLLLLTFRSWRSMLAAGLILAILLAGMKVMREYSNRSVSNEAHEEYLAQMAIYDASVQSYSSAIERFQTKIDAKQNYFNDSVLMQINPHQECVSSVSMVVRTPGLENADETKSNAAQTESGSIVNASNVVHAYNDFIKNGISYESFAQELGVPEQSVRELVLVIVDQFHFSSVFQIQARSADMDFSARLMDYILQQIEEKKGAFRDTLGEYELNVVSRNEETVVDTVLLQQQTDLQNTIATMQKNLQTSQTALKELIKPTEATGASMKQILKHGIKYGVVGMAGGIFLMILLHAIRILMKGRILTDDELNVAYGLRNIITLPAGAARREPRSFIDRFVEKLVSDAPDMSSAAANDVLIAKVENLSAADEIRKVLLVGTVGGTRLESFANRLSKRAKESGSPITFEASADIDKDAEAVRRLRTADACIVVEEVGETAYRDAAEVIELLLASGKPVLGTVYL